jgi:pimeloyl-ACP methyl ester carboxylesterase
VWRDEETAMKRSIGRVLAGALTGAGVWLAADGAQAQAPLSKWVDGANCPSTSDALYNLPDQAKFLDKRALGEVLCEYASTPYTGYDLYGKYAGSWRKRKVVYVTTNRSHKLTAVTGTVITSVSMPVVDVVAYAPSTVGLADKCAQSAAIDTSFQRSVAENGINQILDTQRAVVVPDYEGLGTNAEHPYLDGISSGHATLDLLRVFGSLTNTNLIPSLARYYLLGNSQGAQAVAFAAQQAPTYAPALPLVGGIAVATPANLPKALASVVSKNSDGNLSVGVTLMPFALQGAATILGYDVFSPLKGGYLADTWKSSALRNCTYENLGYALTDPNWYWDPAAHGFSVTNPSDPTLSPFGAKMDAFTLGRARPTVPFVLVHGEKDDVAPYGSAQELCTKWRAGNGKVWLQNVTGGGHINKAPTALWETFDSWFNQLAVWGPNARYTPRTTQAFTMDPCSAP